MLNGWTGTNLEVDLSRGKIERSQNVPGVYEAYLGGKGINIKLYWDRVPPETAPFSEDNLLVFTAGILVGTPCPSANRASISFKSPLSNLFSTSCLGGFWAPELKHAGYDTLVVRGRASSPVYLWISDDNVEIRDASHLWGKDTVQTQRLIRKELDNGRAQIVCIGAAGENKNSAATIQHGVANAAGRGGSGAIMGDKNLKAIAVYGTGDVSIARPAELAGLIELIIGRSETLRNYLSANRHWTGKFAQEFADWGVFGNIDEMPLEFQNMEEYHTEFASRHLVREPSCYNCPFKCMATVSLPELGRPITLKCTSWWSFMCACKIMDLEFSVRCLDLCFRHGLDHLSTANRIAFAIALYQNGILGRNDTGGISLEYGNREVAYNLIEKMARREGIGDILADGVYEAARKIGNGAEKYAHHIKKIEIKFHTYYSPHLAFATAIGDRADTNCAGSAAMVPNTVKWGMEPHEYIEKGWWLFPDEWGRYLHVDHSVGYEGLAEMASYGEDVKTLTDLTGLCWIGSGFTVFPAIKPNMIGRLISFVTGKDVDEGELFRIARRIRTLVQAYNSRLGLRRKDDTVPEKFFQSIISGYQQGKGLTKLDHDKFDRQLDRYYQIKGWNCEGIPTKETLDALGLEFAKHDLEQRGILRE